MNNKPLVSIITPSYNQAAYLDDAMCSVLDQDYPNIEYIVMDGGSTDDSVEIIKRHADRLAYWTSKRDEGQGAAINQGMAHATGDIVAWLNSDDAYLPGAISEAVETLCAHPDISLVYSNYLRINEHGDEINWVKSRQNDLLDLLCFNMIAQPTVFLRRDLWNRLGGLDETMHFMLDHQMWIKVAAEASILYRDRHWAAARYHEAAKNIALHAEFGREAVRLLAGFEDHPLVGPLLAENKNQIYANRARFAGTYLAVHGDARGAWREFAHAVRLYPPIIRGAGLQMALLVLSSLGLLRSQRLVKFFRKIRRSGMERPEIASQMDAA